MKKLTNKWWLVVAAVVLCHAPTVLADSIGVSLTSGGNNVVDGIYMGPYYATVNGVANTPVICDDFKDESYVPESWSANVSSVASPSGTFFSGQQNYDAVADLASQLFATSNKTTDANLQYAIWYIFDPTGVKNWLNSYSDSTTLGAAESLAGTAEGLTYTPGEFANYEILTPNGSMTCSTTSGEVCPPQEFIVQTPEPGTFVLLGFGMLMLGLLARRKRIAGPRLS
jgi:PEP-CTERM motif